MKILALNNNVFYEKENKGLFLYKETGKFFLELYELGHDVKIFQISVPYQTSDSIANYRIDNKGLEVIDIKREGSRYWGYFKAFFKGIESVLKSNFIYLFFPGAICSFMAILAWIFRRKYGLYIRGEQGINNKLSRFLYKRASIIYTVSPGFSKQIQKLNKIKVHTIRPMMSFSETDVIYGRGYSAKESYDLLFVGRIEREKGVFEIVEAIKLLLDGGIHNFQMHFVGDGKDITTLKLRCEELDILSKVTFHGMVSNNHKLKEFYLRCDLFVFPSYHEGFPRVLYESMIFGIPIITTFVGSISEIMKSGNNSFKITPRDIRGLKNKIKDFLIDYVKEAKIAEKGTETIVAYLTDKKMSHAQQLNEFLRSEKH